MAFDLGAVTELLIVEHPNDKSVTFSCRRTDPHLQTKIYRSNKSVKRTRQGTQEDVDAGKFQEDLFVKTVVKWTGIMNGKQELECNEVNKRDLFNKAHNLASFVLNEVTRIEDEEMEYQEKNLNSG